MSSSEDIFMTEAIRLSEEGMRSGSGGPFGAVIVKDGEVIGAGYNRVLIDNDPTAHAEVVAIRHACASACSHSLKGAQLYTSCEPCPMCLAATYWAGIREVFYANTQEDAAKIGFIDHELYDEFRLPQNKRHILVSRMMRSDAIDAFRAWDQKADKTPY